MVPLDAGPAGCTVGDVADEDHHRHARSVRVVDVHRGVLQADGVVHDDRHRLAGHLRVAHRDARRDLFVHAREQFGFRVTAVVGDRLLEPAERRSRHARDVVEADVLDAVDHVVGAGVVNVPAVDIGRRRTGFLGHQTRPGQRRACERHDGRRWLVAPAAVAAAGATPAAAAPAPPAAIPARNPRRSTPESFFAMRDYLIWASSWN